MSFWFLDFWFRGRWKTRWWFRIVFIFSPTWGNDPISPIFFKWVEITHQKICASCRKIYPIFEKNTSWALVFKTSTWNPKHPFINGCFNWMIPNLYIENGCFSKHPFINGCFGVPGICLWQQKSSRQKREFGSPGLVFWGDCFDYYVLLAYIYIFCSIFFWNKVWSCRKTPSQKLKTGPNWWAFGFWFANDLEAIRIHSGNLSLNISGT